MPSQAPVDEAESRGIIGIPPGPTTPLKSPLRANGGPAGPPWPSGPADEGIPAPARPVRRSADPRLGTTPAPTGPAVLDFILDIEYDGIGMRCIVCLKTRTVTVRGRGDCAGLGLCSECLLRVLRREALSLPQAAREAVRAGGQPGTFHPANLRRAVRQGALPGVKLGRNWTVLRTDLRRFVRRRVEKGR
jgi:hypothetical protein